MRPSSAAICPRLRAAVQSEACACPSPDSGGWLGCAAEEARIAVADRFRGRLVGVVPVQLHVRFQARPSSPRERFRLRCVASASKTRACSSITTASTRRGSSGHLGGWSVPRTSRPRFSSQQLALRSAHRLGCRGLRQVRLRQGQAQTMRALWSTTRGSVAIRRVFLTLLACRLHAPSHAQPTHRRSEPR